MYNYISEMVKKAGLIEEKNMSLFKTNPKKNYSKPWKSKIKTIEGKMIKPIEDRMITDIRNLCEQEEKDWN